MGPDGTNIVIPPGMGGGGGHALNHASSAPLIVSGQCFIVYCSSHTVRDSTGTLLILRGCLIPVMYVSTV